MKPHFRHVALIGKYQIPASGTPVPGAQKVLEGIAQFLVDQGCTVAIEANTAANTQLGQYAALETDQIGEQ